MFDKAVMHNQYEDREYNEKETTLFRFNDRRILIAGISKAFINHHRVLETDLKAGSDIIWDAKGHMTAAILINKNLYLCCAK